MKPDIFVDIEDAGASSMGRGAGAAVVAAAALDNDNAAAAPPSAAARPFLTFGLVADVQYAEADDAASFHGVPRYYRNALLGLERALDAFGGNSSSGSGSAIGGCSNTSGASGSGSSGGASVAFCVNLGDSVDGKQRGAPEAGFEAVLRRFRGRPYPSYHVVGNHDLYCLPRPRLNALLGIAPAGPHGGSYYSFEPHPALRVLCLDTYEVSVLDAAQGPDHPLRREAEAVLARNPNENKHHPYGLIGTDRRFVEFGGGVSAAQLEWVAAELSSARAAGQRVVVCGHIPLAPGTAPEPCLVWNYAELLALLEGSGIVEATFSGHAHMNGYTLLNGIHHVVLPSILETPPGRDAYAFVDVTPGALLLRGVDAAASLVLRRVKPCGAPLAPPLPLAALHPWMADGNAGGAAAAVLAAADGTDGGKPGSAAAVVVETAAAVAVAASMP